VIIRMSQRTGPLEFTLIAEPPRLKEGDDGRTFLDFSFKNVRAGGLEISVMLGADEIDRLYAAKPKLASGRKRG
jgi:hypothetical protein